MFAIKLIVSVFATACASVAFGNDFYTLKCNSKMVDNEICFDSGGNIFGVGTLSIGAREVNEIPIAYRAENLRMILSVQACPTVSGEKGRASFSASFTNLKDWDTFYFDTDCANHDYTFDLKAPYTFYVSGFSEVNATMDYYIRGI